jgi:hypothetical protein
LTSCSSDEVLDSDSLVKSRSVTSNVLDYLDVVDGQWVLNLSEQAATDMGKQEDYRKLSAQKKKKINARLLELKDNPKATLGFNLPNERIVMQEGKVLSRTRVSDFERAINRAGSTFITSMTANQSTKFNTRVSDEINVTSTAYVQSMFVFWSFELRDDAFGHYWNESGVASSNLSHDWIYSLSKKPGTDNFWRFSSTGTQTDGTNITFFFIND